MNCTIHGNDVECICLGGRYWMDAALALRAELARVRAALTSISTLVVDPHAAPSFTYSNLCEAVSVARNALEPAAVDGAKTTPRMFPIHSEDRRKLKTPPYAIEWAFLAPHEEQAKANHSQTLERLAERGGCGWDELFAIVRGLSWRELRALPEKPLDYYREGVLADFEKWRAAKPERGPASPGFGDRLTEVVRGATERAAERGATRCPTCDSPRPTSHPAASAGGEVQPCADPWHASTEDGRRMLARVPMSLRGATERACANCGESPCVQLNDCGGTGRAR